MRKVRVTTAVFGTALFLAALGARAQDNQHKQAPPPTASKPNDRAAQAKAKPHKHGKAKATPQLTAASASQSDKPNAHANAASEPASAKTATAAAAPAPLIAPDPEKPVPGEQCSLPEPEQPRGGRLDVLGRDFGLSPVVRIAGRPARMLERRPDRIAVQVPPDSDGGEVSLLRSGETVACGKLTIIGKNR